MSIRVIDSHTDGEPTRTVVAGAPALGNGDMAERLAALRDRDDWLRTSLVTEPRGSECMVGAVLQDPVSRSAAAGVIFFDNAGYLGMCGHGLIGLLATLQHLGQITAGEHLIETPVGNVTARLAADGAVTFDNIISYRWLKSVSIDVPQLGPIAGDVAWGGNWFFISHVDFPLLLLEVDKLTKMTRRIRKTLADRGITGQRSAPIKHVELVGPPSDPAKADARNFVLCPGGQYDRSACGTGTSAKLACLAADGRLAPGDTYRQESIVGGLFEGTYRSVEGGIVPSITGRAYVNGDVRLVINPRDPFRFGILRQQAS